MHYLALLLEQVADLFPQSMKLNGTSNLALLDGSSNLASMGDFLSRISEAYMQWQMRRS